MKLTLHFLGYLYFSAGLFAGDVPISTPTIFKLPDAKLNGFTSGRITPSKEDCFQIYQHFSLAEGDERRALPWLIQAAQEGHQVAQYNYGVLLCKEKTSFSIGLRWLEKAADSGSEAAKRTLLRLKNTR